MEVTDSTAAAVKGIADPAIESASKQIAAQRFMDRKELIDRLAKAMRLKSGLDLPHGYFVEQVKLQLAGSPAFDRSLLGQDDEADSKAASLQSADCFRAWAIPE